MEEKTGYDWCEDAKLRVIDISNWDTDWANFNDSYYKEKINVQEFYRRLDMCRVKANSMPRKTEMYLEYRMYGLVPYNLSPIQQGIQFGHGVIEYSLDVYEVPPFNKIYQKWAKEDKTFIILNGGTTNLNPDNLGTLNKHFMNLHFNGVATSIFCEPDLGDQLTAVVFLVDERVFNKVRYPDFKPTPLSWLADKKPTEKEQSKWQVENDKHYVKWVESVGGETNVYLREYLKTLKLA